MAFDFKKEYKEFYLPKRTPELVSVPPMTFVAVRGEGDPNVEGGAYKGGRRRAVRHRLYHQDVENGRPPASTATTIS